MAAVIKGGGTMRSQAIRLLGAVAVIVVIATRTQDQAKMSLPVYILIGVVAGSLAGDFVTTAISHAFKSDEKVSIEDRWSIRLAGNIVAAGVIGVFVWATPSIMRPIDIADVTSTYSGKVGLLSFLELLLVFILPVCAGVVAWQIMNLTHKILDRNDRPLYGMMDALSAVGGVALCGYLIVIKMIHTYAQVKGQGQG